MKYHGWLVWIRGFVRYTRGLSDAELREAYAWCVALTGSALTDCPKNIRLPFARHEMKKRGLLK